MPNTPFLALGERVQAHIKACAQVVSNDHVMLSDIMHEADEFCLKLTSAVQHQNAAAHSHMDGLVTLQGLRQHVDKTKSIMQNILRTLARLEPILDTEQSIKACADGRSFPWLIEITEADNAVT